MRDARVDLAITAPEAVTLVIRSPFFPGWRARIDDRETVPVVDAASGYMRVAVPAGSHRVRASFERDRLRTIAEAITLVCLATLLAIVGRRRSTAESVQRHRAAMFDDGQRR